MNTYTHTYIFYLDTYADVEDFWSRGQTLRTGLELRTDVEDRVGAED